MNADNQLGDAPVSGTRRRIGITGHLDLSGATLRLVTAELRHHLRAILGENTHAEADESGDTGGKPSDERHGEAAELIGVSCLARGADTVFAEVLIELGGRLEVILPSADYRQAQVLPDHAPRFDSLLSGAASVEVIPDLAAGPQAYVAANNAMLDRVDSLVAVWDGEAGVEGGTGHVVNEARTRQIPVTVIWPKGSRRA